MPNRSRFIVRLTALALAVSCSVFNVTAPAYADQPKAAPAAAATQAPDFRLPAYAPDSLKVHKSPNDPSDYRALRLPNGLQVLLVHNPQADRSAAAMTVDVGSANDPADIPGLAHFNEHMLFLGTDKYPGATDYQDFLKSHGGKFNAGTSSQTTTYFFDIAPSFFQEALARFSRFFIAPQFNAEFVDQERHAVDSEYHMRLRDDSRRVQEALFQAFNPEHPFTRFGVGNLDTLKDGQQPLRQRLLDFYQHHYDANVMHLALVGPGSLDQLESQARSLFQAVPNRGLKPPKIDIPLFTQQQLPAQLEVQTLQQGNGLSFLFPVPDPQQYPLAQPDIFIAGLVGHEGQGSLLATLRKAGWANGLSAGTDRSDKKHALFAVRINLTPEGAQHQDQIQATLFAYIEKIRHSLQQKWRYDEQALLQAQQYPFLQVGFGVGRAAELSSAMSLLPLSEVNIAPFRMERFDPALIQSYLNRLSPNNLLRTYTSPDVQGDQHSRWYNTPYSLKKITTWPEAPALAGLALPERNRFIARDFRIDKVDDAKPRQLLKSPGLNLWYQGNASFGSPSANWRIHLLSPKANNDLRQGLMNFLLALWLNDQVDEALYPAALAGQSANASGQARGLALSLAGWRDKQPEVLATLLDQLRNAPIEQANFNRLHRGLDEWLANRRQQLVASTLMGAIDERLASPSFSLAQGQEALHGISLDDLRQYREQWLKSLHAEVLVVGNLTEQDARKGAEAIARTLTPQVALDRIPKLQALQIAAKMPTLRPDSDNNDAAALSFRVAPNTGLKTSASWMLLGQILSGPFYSELRTRQQLGYVVGANHNWVANAAGLSTLIQSPGHSSDELFQRMDGFLQGFRAKIDSLDAQSLKPYQQSVINTLLHRPQDLAELTAQQDQQLTYRQLTFDFNQRLAQEVAQLKPSDIQAAWKTFLAQPQFKVAHDKDIAPNEKAYSANQGLAPVPD